MRRLVVFVFPLFLSIALSLAHSAQLIDKIVAAVNGEIITQKQLNQEIFLIKKVWRLEDEKELREIVLKRMIEKQILFQEAEKEKITVSSQMVEEAVSDVQRRFSDNTFEKMLEEGSITLEKVREILRKELMGERLKAYKAKKIEKELKIEEKEIQDFYLDLKKYIEKGGEAKEEIKEFYRKHREELTSSILSNGSSTILPECTHGLTFEEIRDKIREFLKQRKKETALREWLKGLISKADIQILDEFKRN